jgi:hypothetical protein
VLKKAALITLPVIAAAAALGALIAYGDWDFDDGVTHTVRIVEEGPAEGLYVDGEHVEDWSAYDDVAIYVVDSTGEFEIVGSVD